MSEDEFIAKRRQLKISYFVQCLIWLTSLIAHQCLMKYGIIWDDLWIRLFRSQGNFWWLLCITGKTDGSYRSNLPEAVWRYCFLASDQWPDDSRPSLNPQNRSVLDCYIPLPNYLCTIATNYLFLLLSTDGKILVLIWMSTWSHALKILHHRQLTNASLWVVIVQICDLLDDIRDNKIPYPVGSVS